MLNCSCKRCNERVSEAKYPVTSKDINGGTPVVLGKIKRVKSMQPKPFEEQVARSLGKYSTKYLEMYLYNVNFGTSCYSH